MRAGFGDETYPKIFLQLLLGLRELHKREFAHRDLKKENILVDNDLTLCICDPDFMKSEKQQVLKTFLGTPPYAAPEIWPGRSRSYGVSADIWSLAICILHLFYGLQWPSDPFPGLHEADKLEDWITKWCNAVLEHLDELDENNQIIDILKPMLELGPETRSTVDQCLQRGCENGLFKQNRLGDIVLAEATDVDTEVNTLAGLPALGKTLDKGAKTPTPKSPLLGDPANVSLLSTTRLGEISGDDEDKTVPHPTSSSISDLLAFPASAIHNPIPTSGLPEHISGCREGEETPTAHSRSTSESQRSRRPARRLKVSSGNVSESPWTIGPECSSFESGLPLDD